MSMYKNFQTDANLEKNGITIDYGDFRVLIARAGGANKKFAKVLDAKTKPYRRAIQTESIETDRIMEILKEAYAECIVLNWETKVVDKDGKEEWKKGIEDQDGKLLDFTKENVVTTFKNLHDLFLDIREQSEKSSLFRQVVRETEAGN